MQQLTKKPNPKLVEAQGKLKAILKKAKLLGIQHQKHVICSVGSKLLHQPGPSRMFYFSLGLSVLLIIFGFKLHVTAFNFVVAGSENHSQCAVVMPDAVTRFFRPPVACSVCDQVTEVEKISKISTQEFEDRYAYSGRPVVITDAMANWSAPTVFSYEFFRSLYKEHVKTVITQQCQFFPYQTEFQNLGEFLNLTDYTIDQQSPWYVGWSNCDVKVTETLRKHYGRPYFLPPLAEGKRLDWIFMGSKGYGAPMHVDHVEYPSWQAQLRGQKKWRLQPPPECLFSCQSMEVVVEPGETIVLDTNRWFHSTQIMSEEVSITIGAEFD